VFPQCLVIHTGVTVITNRPNANRMYPRSLCNLSHLTRIVGRDSSVGIATRYGLDRPGSNPADSSGRAV
jgi:hypothetical protein